MRTLLDRKTEEVAAELHLSAQSVRAAKSRLSRALCEAFAQINFDVPTLDGKCVSYPIKSHSMGNFRVMLSVRSAEPSLDLGIDRQTKSSPAEDGKQFSVRVEGGKCTLQKSADEIYTEKTSD